MRGYAVFERTARGKGLAALIRATTPEGGTVADVFCGGGSLGAAALALGRRAILSDASATHVAAARARFIAR